jgi:hypothetical protein
MLRFVVSLPSRKEVAVMPQAEGHELELFGFGGRAC